MCVCVCVCVCVCPCVCLCAVRTLTYIQIFHKPKAAEEGRTPFMLLLYISKICRPQQICTHFERRSVNYERYR